MQIEIDIDATPERVWDVLGDLGSHAEWMADADSIEFGTDQRRGVGTQIRVPTRVGPLRTVDVMTVTRWEEAKLIEARHEGAVTGTGTFELRATPSGSILVWTEDLSFPWWLGGRLGHVLARPILRRIWTKNLARFKSLLESGGQLP